MKTIIAEKPSVARDIARVLGANTKKDGYIEGKGFQVTWAFGHLVTLEDAKAYGYGRWEFDTLPVIPEKFKLKLNSDRNDKSKADSGVAKQFNIIKGLFESSDEIIVATDAGREGELIFRYIYSLTNIVKPFRRLWISSLTDEAIKKGFSCLEKGNKYDDLYDSAISRSESDWLVGINGTIALTTCSSSGTLLSLGRVQTPVLAMICERYTHNINFDPKPYFVPQLVLKKDNIAFKANYSGRFDTDEKAKEIIANIGDNISCVLSEKKPKNEKQPLLFDLTSLQAEANKRFKFSAQKTLEIMQKLYEQYKVVTYPRTSSRHLSEDIYKKLPDLFLKVKGYADYKGFVEKLIDTNKLPKRSVDDKKVTDHHAVIPTGVVSNALNHEEEKVFGLVMRRFIAAFSPICKKEVTSYKFDNGSGVFSSSGVVIISLGWRTVEKEVKEKKDDSDENDQLPKIVKDDLVDVKEKLVQEKKTKPKPIHSESSLLKLMETAGKDIEDEELSKAIRDCGIGTPATRASIIETLLKRTYIIRQKNKLVPTELGLSVYENVKGFSIASPEMTGQWEYKLNQMAEGRFLRSNFMTEIKDYVANLMNEISSVAENISDGNKCPKCKKGRRVERDNFIVCHRNKGKGEGACDFIFWKTVFNKKLPAKQIEKIFENGQTEVIKGFKSKAGNKFDARLTFDDDFKIKPLFAEREPERPKLVKESILLSCPKCKEGTVVKGKTAYGCLKFKEGCDFRISLEMGGKKLTENSIKLICEKGTTNLIKGFIGKTGKKFQGKLKFDGHKVVFDSCELM